MRAEKPDPSDFLIIVGIECNNPAEPYFGKCILKIIPEDKLTGRTSEQKLTKNETLKIAILQL